MRGIGCVGVILFVVIAAQACSATMVNAPGASSASSPYAPVNEASRGGMIKYLNQGASYVVEQRREDAYKQMYTACRGTYRIDAEGPNAEGGAAIPIQGGGAVWTQSQYWYIQFSCAPQPPTQGGYGPSQSQPAPAPVSPAPPSSAPVPSSGPPVPQPPLRTTLEGVSPG